MGHRESITDVIPADMVVNSVIAAMAVHQNPSSHTVVYHISSSMRNHQLIAGDIAQLFIDYFKKSSWIDERGKPVKVKEFCFLNGIASLHNYIAIHYMLNINLIRLAFPKNVAINVNSHINSL
ncbi:hypothetical protein BC332_32716 [Capsicum chinense]|nr:hypothetical protein BC332_32716 [Capsicum chinense]